MAPKKLEYDLSLDTHRDELIYSEARVLKHAHAAAVAPNFLTLQERLDQVQVRQRACWKREVLAQAGVDHADDALDDAVEEVSEQLLRVIPARDRTNPRYVRYFKAAASVVVRMGLASELDVVREWPASLKTEPEDAVKKAGVALEKAIHQGEAAVRERDAAMAATADQRVREIVRLVDDINAVRLSAYGALVGMVETHHEKRDWPERFFRRESKVKKKASAPVVVPDPQPTPG